MIKFFLYIWELPQNIIGLLIRPFYKCEQKLEYKERTIRVCPSFPGGISLADTIIVRHYPHDKSTWDDVKHEWGHGVDSKMMGWFYLLIIGIPSLIWAACYKYDPSRPNAYYTDFYTERRADKNGGVER